MSSCTEVCFYIQHWGKWRKNLLRGKIHLKKPANLRQQSNWSRLCTKCHHVTSVIGLHAEWGAGGISLFRQLVEQEKGLTKTHLTRVAVAKSLLNFDSCICAKKWSATHQLSKQRYIVVLWHVPVFVVSFFWLPGSSAFQCSWPEKLGLLAHERDFPWKVRPKILCLQPNMITKEFWVPLSWKQQMFIVHQNVAADYLSPLRTLTLVLAVGVSVLVSQLPVGARPVTRCLLAGQEKETMHRGKEQMHKW